MWETKFSESQFPAFWELNKLMLRSIFINIFTVGKFSLSLLQWSFFFSIITVKSRFKWIGRPTGLISGGKSLVREIDYLYVVYGNLRDSTLRETNKYSNF